jgi:hypothetical protein
MHALLAIKFTNMYARPMASVNGVHAWPVRGCIKKARMLQSVRAFWRSSRAAFKAAGSH